jgi:hypothetical protein
MVRVPTGAKKNLDLSRILQAINDASKLNECNMLDVLKTA